MESIKIPLDEIQEYVSSFDKPNSNVEDSYTKSYCALLSYFSNKDQLTKDQLIVGAHAVYGWMPKILRIDLDESDVKALNQAKQSVKLFPEQLIKLRNSIGNSIIGVSKLLHFINPSFYPIYDTHIYKFLCSHNDSNNKGHFYQVNNIEVYQGYVQSMRDAAETEQGKVIKTLVSANIKYDVTPIRAIELSMFYMQRDSNS